jgi:hypothetical protein
VLAFDGAFGLALLGLWLYCIVDVVTTDESLIRNLPKMVWLLIVVFLPDVGSIVWLIAGRPPRASFRIGDTAGSRPAAAANRRPVGPEDRANFGVDLDSLSPIVREREEQAQLRLREEQLRRREEDLARKEREADLMRREDELLRREQRLGSVEPVVEPVVEPPADAPPADAPPTEPRPGGSKLEE